MTKSPTDKITQDEMVEMFGQSMPVEAVSLLFDAPPEMTIGEIRAKLRTMALPRPMQLAKAVINEACTDPKIWATHGRPGDAKLDWLENRIAKAIETALAE